MHGIISSYVFALLSTFAGITQALESGPNESCTTFTPISNYTQWGYSHRVSAGTYCPETSSEPCSLDCGGFINQPTFWNISDEVNYHFSNYSAGVLGLFPAVEAGIKNTSNNSYAYFGSSMGIFGQCSVEVPTNSSIFVVYKSLMQCFVGTVSNCNASFVPNDTIIATCSPMQTVNLNGTISNDFAGLLSLHQLEADAQSVANLTTNPAEGFESQTAITKANQTLLEYNWLNVTGVYGFGGWNNETDHPDGLVPKYGALGIGEAPAIGDTHPMLDDPTSSTNGTNGTSSGTNGTNGISSGTIGTNGTNSTSGHKSVAARGTGFTMATTILVLGTMAAMVL